MSYACWFFNKVTEISVAYISFENIWMKERRKEERQKSYTIVLKGDHYKFVTNFRKPVLKIYTYFFASSIIMGPIQLV